MGYLLAKSKQLCERDSMGKLIEESLSAIKETILRSNRDALDGSQKYVVWEGRAIRDDYEFIPCGCDGECWCRQHGCQGHYRIGPISFEQFLSTYVNLWVPPSGRNALKEAVLHDREFKGRQRNAVAPLKSLQDRWSEILASVRQHTLSGLCRSGIPNVWPRVANLYEAKMWSQLYYDCLVPFDTASKRQIEIAGYPNPDRDFIGANRELFRDLRMLAERNNLTVADLRVIDQPWKISPAIQQPLGGQPLSRVLDKVFYTPRTKKGDEWD